MRSMDRCFNISSGGSHDEMNINGTIYKNILKFKKTTFNQPLIVSNLWKQ